MSYQVLARKWRPQSFKELVGQEHVLKALVNALDRDQLHHAYLFTGTRGVGKTTIARILARCLNCETGVSSVPCGTCSACTEISEGRFVDLIEVDAASRTKVEDTRELLENVQYAPVRGRFKVYLIDEVHMLSTHSFNAMLKTLEEPPPHVKFLLATTDPQKLPATVLSRCLQFHLKNMSPERIVGHLENVLSSEVVQADNSALWAIAHAAEGSMRDALSLTDQAIAFGGGQIKDTEVRDMLGSIDRAVVWRILEALQIGDAQALMDKVESLAQHSADFSAVLEELLHCLHLVMRQQLVPEANAQLEQKETLKTLAETFTPEQVQLYYQIGLNGRRDIAYTPNARQGVEVVLMRMLAFKPVVTTGLNPKLEAPTVKKPDSVVAEPVVVAASINDEQAVIEPLNSKPKSASRPKLASALLDVSVPYQAETAAPAALEEPKLQEPEPQESQTPAQRPFSVEEGSDATQQWLATFTAVKISGVLKSVASQCELQSQEADHWRLILNEAHSAMLNTSHAAQLSEAVSSLLAKSIKVSINVGETFGNTPAAVAQALAESKHGQAMQALQSDPVVQHLIQDYGAIILPDTVTLKEA